MGFFKSVGTVTRKVVTGPKAYIVPRVVRKTGKQLFNYDNRVNSIYCPRCGESYLKLLEPTATPQRVKESAFYLVEDIPEDSLVYWVCPECGFGFEADTYGLKKSKDTIEQVRDFIRDTSLDELHSDIEITDDEIEEKINNHMRTSRIYFFISFIFIMFMMIGAIKGAILFVLAISLFIATLVLIALKWSYRAWQLRTNSLYAENPKEQFLTWLSTNNPFKAP
ncbi:MAG: hypothetical protein VYA60_04360 [Pseudomonadota bacterium]|nr:hypothetical protein [Pseudomonadota bacterium]